MRVVSCKLLKSQVCKFCVSKCLYAVKQCLVENLTGSCGHLRSTSTDQPSMKTRPAPCRSWHHQSSTLRHLGRRMLTWGIAMMKNTQCIPGATEGGAISHGDGIASMVACPAATGVHLLPLLSCRGSSEQVPAGFPSVLQSNYRCHGKQTCKTIPCNSRWAAYQEPAAPFAICGVSIKSIAPSLQSVSS